VAASLENTRLLEETRTSLEQLDSLYRRQTADSWQALLELLQADRSVTSAEYAGPRYPDAITDGGDPLEAPIEIHGETIGLLEVLGEKPGEWTEDEREIVRAVADEVAAALEQTRLLEELQRRAAQLQTAAEVARDATGLLDIDTLLRRTVRLIQERFGYHHIAVFLTDEQGQYAEIAEGSGAAGEQMKSEGHRLEVGSESIIGHVTLRGEHYLANQVDQDPLFKPHPALPDMQTELAIPLRVGERIIGALDVQHDSPGAFSADDIAVLQILADQLAVAIQNARLFEETLQRARREQLVLQLTGEVRKREDVEGMLKAAVREMRKAMGAKRSRIRLYPRPLDADEDNENGPPPSEHPPAGDQPLRGDGE
ncbi:MAG TPA: GAF domain-containing protein, partial [Chloroflexi bacterium]|nr:GAF domain-containing protein [Chloroflexota bacterium]